MKRASLPAMVLAVLASASPLSAAVFQYRIPINLEKKTEKGVEKVETSAFLWIPASARQVRGVIMSGMTLAERELSKDPIVRKMCEEQQLAIIFMKTGLESTDLQPILKDAAALSGYGEIAHAPLLFVGHSAGGPQARNMAVKYADRCIGLMQYRGGPPWDSAVTPGTPSLMMVGAFDEFGGTARDAEGVEAWEKHMTKLAEKRATPDGPLWSLVAEPGAGHFAWSDRNAAYFALWAKKAAAARIPDFAVDAKEPVKVKEVAAKTGWLSGTTIKTLKEIWPVEGAVSGDGVRSPGSWHFDKELAQASADYHHPKVGAAFGLKDQFIKWNDPFWVDAGTRYFFTSIKWVGDGQTFQVHPVYAGAYPSQHKPIWADAGKPVGHARTPIKIKRVSGAVEPLDDHRFRFRFDNLAPASEGGRVTFMAYSEGDAEYRYTEHVGMLPRGFSGLKDGKDQTITFEAPATIKADAPVELKATSDAGLPVEYYVAEGPAEIEGNKLKVAEVPARAKFPITIKVVAYQFGSGVEPKVKTARPVEQVLTLEK